MNDSRLSRRISTTHLIVVGTVAGTLLAAAPTAAFADPKPVPTPKSSGQSGERTMPRPHALDTTKTDQSGSDTRTPAPAVGGKFRGAGAGAVAGSYIVVLKNAKATKEQVRQNADTLAAAHHGKVGEVFSKALRAFSTTMTEADAKKLAADPAVAYVEQNRAVHAADTQNTATSSYSGFNLWSLDRIDQPFLPVDHQYTYPNGANDVTVYVLDTGVSSAHQEFAGNPGFQHGWTSTFDILSPECTGVAADGADDNGHGTEVASVIAGRTFGVAKGAPIESVKVLDCQGSGTELSVIRGVEHVTETAAKPAVVNMSLGGPGSTAIDDEIKASIASGLTYVVAAGNENKDACVTSPARVPEAITVGATDVTDFRASFSNYGSCLDTFAPGVNVEVAYKDGVPTNGDFTFRSGTSFSSPLVAGDAALLLHAHPTWTPAQVSAAITGAGIAGTVHGAGAGSTTKLLRVGEPAAPNSFGLRSHANNLIVTAESGGAKPLIANRYNVGAWEGLTVVDAGDGQHVALRSSANNLYVTAESAGAQPLIARGTAIGDWEKFTLIHNANGSISLQAAVNGKYVTAENYGTQPLIANRDAIGLFEEFDLAGPAATVFMVAWANLEVVSADNGGASPLIANAGNMVSPWEIFDLVDAGGYAALLAHANGLFVTAESAGAQPLIARASAVGDWEKYTIINLPDGGFSMVANANGLFVTAESAGAKPLIARGTAIGDWEEFILYTTDELG